MSKVVRVESHEIDTKARAIIPTLIPSTWECREVGGRDYGIDLQLERFESGTATGNILLLQIKGTRLPLDESNLYFDLPIQTLKYAEMFVVPFLLVVCPVDVIPHRAYFCWLQEHIKVNLDFDKPTWRENTSQIRIRLEREIQLPSSTTALDWISQEPQRQRDWLKVATLQHNFKSLIPKLAIHLGQSPQGEDISSGKKFIEEIRSLKTLFSHPTGYLLAHYLFLLDESLKLMQRGGPYFLKDLKFAGAVEELPAEVKEFNTEDQTARALLTLNLQTATDGMMTTLSQYFDDGLKRAGLMISRGQFGVKRREVGKAAPFKIGDGD